MAGEPLKAEQADDSDMKMIKYLLFHCNNKIKPFQSPTILKYYAIYNYMDNENDFMEKIIHRQYYLNNQVKFQRHSYRIFKIILIHN